MTWVNTTVNLKPLRTTIIVAVTTTILYYLTIGIAVDAVDGFVEADVAAGQLPDVSIINAILGMYTLVIAGSFIISAALLSNDAMLAGISIVTGGIVVLIVVFLGLMGYPGMMMSPDRWLIAPALYTAFVLQDPGMFIAIESGCFIGMYLVTSSVHSVIK